MPPGLIRAIRRASGKSVRGFAEQYGISHSIFSLWENGRRRPSRMAVSLLTLIVRLGHVEDPARWAPLLTRIQRLQRNQGRNG